MSGEHPSPPSRIQRWLFVLLAAALVFLTANALAWLASYRVAPAMHLFDPDPYRGARLKPGLDLSLPLGAGRRQLWAKTGARYRVVTDARGFRAGRPEVEAPGSPPAAFTVICVGDSSTFGQDVEDGQTYPRLLEKLLPPLLPGRTVRVINAGVPNAASRQGLVYLGRELLDDRPDLVVFAFIIGRPVFLNDGFIKNEHANSPVFEVHFWPNIQNSSLESKAFVDVLHLGDS